MVSIDVSGRMERPLAHFTCAKCAKDIHPTWGNKLLCRSCGEIVHQSCWSLHPYPHCPLCGGLSSSLFRRPDKVPEHFSESLEPEDDAPHALLGNARGERNTELDENVRSMDEEERRRIRAGLAKRKGMFFGGGVLASVFGVVCLLVLILLCTHHTAVHTSTFSVLCGIILGGMAMGGILAKHCFSRALARSRFQNAIDLTKRFHEEALQLDPNPELLLELLHPATVKSLGPEGSKQLHERWRSLRNTIERSLWDRPAYWHAEVLRVDESPSDHPDEKHVEVTVAVSCWQVTRRYRPTRLIGHKLLRIGNRCVRTDYGWVLVHPFPDDSPPPNMRAWCRP